MKAGIPFPVPFWKLKRRESHGGAAFDLSGDLSAIPIAYLWAALRHAGPGTPTQTIAQEIERRGQRDWLTRRYSGGTCDYCARIGMYIVGTRLFCGRHREAGIAARTRIVRGILEPRYQDYDRQNTAIDQLRRRRESLRHTKRCHR